MLLLLISVDDYDPTVVYQALELIVVGRLVLVGAWSRAPLSRSSNISAMHSATDSIIRCKWSSDSFERITRNVATCEQTLCEYAHGIVGELCILLELNKLDNSIQFLQFA